MNQDIAGSPNSKSTLSYTEGQKTVTMKNLWSFIVPGVGGSGGGGRGILYVGIKKKSLDDKFENEYVLFGLVFLYIGSHGEAQNSGGYHP